MSWYETAYSHIKQQQMENPNLGHVQMRKYCSANYPFCERRGYAYKAWLKAMRDIFGAARKPKQTSQVEIDLDND